MTRTKVLSLEEEVRKLFNVIFVSKLVSLLLSPLLWIIVLLLAGIATREHRKRKRRIIASLFLLLVFSNTFLFDRFAYAWEIKPIPENKLAHYDAAIVLTGMATYDVKNDRLEFNDRTDRLMQAIRLYKMKYVDTIILSGGSVLLNGADTLEAGKLKNYLTILGIPENEILLEARSRNTHENATMVRSLLPQNPDDSYLLITSAMHLRRATACFLKEGIPVVPYSTDRLGGPMKWELDYLLLPSAETLFHWERLLHEWVGYVSYDLRGYL